MTWVTKLPAAGGRGQVLGIKKGANCGSGLQATTTGGAGKFGAGGRSGNFALTPIVGLLYFWEVT